MRILFDHGTPSGIIPRLAGHAVTEARDRGGDRISNGDLLDAAESAGTSPPDPPSSTPRTGSSPWSIAGARSGTGDAEQQPILAYSRPCSRLTTLCALPAYDFVDSFREFLKFRLCSGAGRVLPHRETTHHGFGHYDPLPDSRQYLLPQFFQ
jgi:hypothetical protein